MKTFPVTIENLSIHHIGRALGYLLGLTIVIGIVASFVAGFIIVGTAEFMQRLTLQSVAISTASLFFGVLLLFPRKKFKKWPLLRGIFIVTSLAFLWRCSAMLVNYTGGGELSEYPWPFPIVIAVIAGIAIWNIVAVIQNKGEQDAAMKSQP